jgi:hypothetical protein
MLYKKVDAASPNSITAALDLFSTPPTNCAVSNSMYREYYTLNPITSRPFLFKIHPLTSMIDLSKIYVITELRIREIDTDGSLVDIAPDEVVSTIQMPGATFIKDLRVLINQKEIYNSNQLYSYKVYLDTELSFPTSVKDAYLSSAGYFEDDKNQNVVSGKGFIARKNMFAKSKTTQFIHKLDADIFNTDLFLITNTEMDIEITPQSNNFITMQREPAKVTPPAPPEPLKKFMYEIVNIKLMVKTIDLMDGLSLEIANKLDTEPARYPVRKTSLKQTFISAGRTDFVANIFTEEVPRRVIIGLVSNANFNGDIYTSPFKFEHFKVREIELMANGRVYPQQPYNLDYTNNLYVKAYHDFQEHLGFANTTESNGIDYSRYRSGWCFYVFNMTNAQEESPGFELVKDGSTVITIRFDSPVPAGGIQIIAYAESDGYLKILFYY